MRWRSAHTRSQTPFRMQNLFWWQILLKPEPNDSKNGCELPCRLPAVFQKPTRPETEDICAKWQQQQIYLTILRCVPFYFWGPFFFLNKVCVEKLSFWIKAVSFVRGERALISLSFTAGQRSDRPYRASDLPCMSHLSGARWIHHYRPHSLSEKRPLQKYRPP